MAEVFRVNYYVGAVLAQGGNVWLDGSKIVFSPTSAIDRAMGAQNVEIPLQQIRALDRAGVLARSLRIKTEEKVHRFEGGQVQRFLDLLEKALPNVAVLPVAVRESTPAPAAKPASPAPVKAAVPAAPAKAAPVAQTPRLVCGKCAKTLQPGFSFCPHCGGRPASVCGSCHRAVDPSWIACAFCGSKAAFQRAA